MSIFFDITHVTHYRYAQPVMLGENRVMFRPRDSHDLRVLATDLQVTPPQQEIRMIQDVYSNSVALVQPQSPASDLKVVCTFSVEHTGTRELLVAMTKLIRDTMQYQPRFEEGVQTPVETLRLQSGTCRDFATLMVKSVRHLGYARPATTWAWKSMCRCTGAAKPLAGILA